MKLEPAPPHEWMNMLAAAVYIVFLACLIVCQYQGKNRPALVFKVLASLCFVACGCFALRRLGPGADTRWLAQVILFALICGAAGDIFLGIRHFFPRETRAYQLSFIPGIFLFLAGNLVYAWVAFRGVETPLLALLVTLVLVIPVLYLLHRAYVIKAAYLVLGVVYLSVLFSFAVGAVFCLFQGYLFGYGFHVAYAVGGCSFAVADVCTIRKSFTSRSGSEMSRLQYVMDLPFYYLAQMAIASSILFLV